MKPTIADAKTGWTAIASIIVFRNPKDGHQWTAKFENMTDAESIPPHDMSHIVAAIAAINNMNLQKLDRPPPNDVEWTDIKARSEKLTKDLSKTTGMGASMVLK